MKHMKWYERLIVVMLVAVMALLVVAACTPVAIVDEPFMDVTVDKDLITGAAGIALSILFSYIPALSVWYYKKITEVARSCIMLGLLILVSVAIYLLGCYGIFGGVECGRAGIYTFVRIFIVLFLSNQGTYLISPAKVGKQEVEPAG